MNQQREAYAISLRKEKKQKFKKTLELDDIFAKVTPQGQLNREVQFALNFRGYNHFSEEKDKEKLVDILERVEELIGIYPYTTPEHLLIITQKCVEFYIVNMNSNITDAKIIGLCFGILRKARVVGNQVLYEAIFKVFEKVIKSD